MVLRVCTKRCDFASIYSYSTQFGRSDLYPTLQIVKNFQPPRLGCVVPPQLYQSRLPLMLGYGLVEYVVILFTTMWTGSWLQELVVDPSKGTMGTWLTALALVWGCKIAYILFLVWEIPLYLIVVVDISSVLWLLRAIRTIAPDSSRTASCLVAGCGIAARFAYRAAVQWCPLFITADLLLDVIE